MVGDGQALTRTVMKEVLYKKRVAPSCPVNRDCAYCPTLKGNVPKKILTIYIYKLDQSGFRPGCYGLSN